MLESFDSNERKGAHNTPITHHPLCRNKTWDKEKPTIKPIDY